MKRYSNLWLMAVAAVATLTVTACSQEEMQDISTNNVPTLTATIGGKADTRTTVADDNTAVHWSENDKLGLVYTKDSSTDMVYSYTLSEGAGTTTGKFSLDSSPSTDGYTEGAYVAYPYASDLKITAAGQVSMTLPSTFAYTQASNGPMGGQVVDGAITFKHLAGLIKVTLNKIPSGASKFVLTASQAIAGSFTANLSDAAPRLVASSSEMNSKEVTVTIGSIPETNTMSFFIPVPAGTYTNLSIALQNSSSENLYIHPWSNLTVGVGTLLYATLDAVTVSASTPDELNTALSSNINPTENAASNVFVTGTVSTASQTNTALQIPVASGAQTNISFATAPVASQTLPLVIEEKENITNPVSSELSVAIPQVAAEAEAPSITITMPNTTVSLAPVGETASFGKIIAKTAANTLIINAGVTVEELVVAGGNVEIYGTVKKLSRDAENTDETTSVASFGAADIQAVDFNNENKIKLTSTWDGVSRVASNSGNIYTAAQLANLQSVQAPTDANSKNLPTTVSVNTTLYTDIDLANNGWLGMVIKDVSFDGGNHTISNLNMSEFILNQQQTTFTPSACIGLFAAVYSSSTSAGAVTIKNITLDNVSIKPDAAKSPKWVGALVGLSMAKVAYTNCVAKNVEIYTHGNSSYRVGGLIGYIEAFMKDNTPENVKLTDCKVETASIAATYSYGGLVGSMYDSAAFEGCSVSNITLSLNDGDDIVHGYVSPFIGDIANSTGVLRTITIKNCTSYALTAEQKTALGFDKISSEQPTAFPTKFIDDCKWCGIVEPAALNANKITIKVTENGSEKTLVAGVDFNKCESATE